ncbi:alpha/beta hydrolase [Pseudoflavitalea sp. G-6-1-2]|uniref:alpha/beta fold hydrolase n=1 Tax=Pseudoflavitalea sp. G-6-1-2 TaxID=2728841 RepID=UPI00146CCF2C|nr:alpha/beta hydrolase [Pseudoflavitalea sp. G-6-1-2]NML21299.1 alpha/beta hydrolase [Pseudoflavitalea sp. G-6-1-2]
MTLKQIITTVIFMSTTLLSQAQKTPSITTPKGVKNVVLVHGAFADGSSWSKVIPLLQAKGLHVIAVQNPLISFDEDVAATKRAIAQMDGPVLLAGHSYGGMVISEAGKDPKVAGLLYVAALVPEEGQNVNDVNAAMPPTAVGPEILLSNGFLSLSPKAVNEFFAQDATPAERKIIYVVQTPWAVSATQQKVYSPAWQTKPSWSVIAARDGMINPDLQRFKAKLIKANSIELSSGHVPMVTMPQKVAAFILDAAAQL